MNDDEDNGNLDSKSHSVTNQLLNVYVEDPSTALSKDSAIVESSIQESTEMDDDEDNGNLDSKSQSVTNQLLNVNVEDPPTALSNDSSIVESSIQESTKMDDDEVNANSYSLCGSTNIEDPTNATSQSSAVEVPAEKIPSQKITATSQSSAVEVPCKKFPLQEITVYGNPTQYLTRNGKSKEVALINYFAALHKDEDKDKTFLLSIYGSMDFLGHDVRTKCSIHLGRKTYAWAFQVTDDKEAILLTVQPMQIMKVGKNNSHVYLIQFI